MPKRLPNILAINPGSRYLGMAAFHGPELLDWRVKEIDGKGSGKRPERAGTIVGRWIEQYDPDVLAIKRLHPSRSSQGLDRLAAKIVASCRRNGLQVFRYSIQDLEAALSPEEPICKPRMAEIVASLYPVLFHELRKEQRNKNAYHLRMFEAVALGIVCHQRLEEH
jgi:hypothetical protein